MLLDVFIWGVGEYFLTDLGVIFNLCLLVFNDICIYINIIDGIEYYSYQCSQSCLSNLSF